MILLSSHLLSEEVKTFEFICQLCKTHVHNRTKHCGECNRCVAVFDHHCKWLNNCIGELNYKWFMALITIYLTQQIFTLGLMSYISYLWCQETHALWHIIIILIIGLFAVAKLGALLQLLGWHIWFGKNNMTTFEYILEQRDLHELKIKLKDGIITQTEYQKLRQEIIDQRVQMKK